jgi:hypothetical protein
VLRRHFVDVHSPLEPRPRTASDPTHISPAMGDTGDAAARLPPQQPRTRVSLRDAALLGAGMMLVSGASLAYRAKRTAAFKALYFASWPVLGTAVIVAFGPDRRGMEAQLRAGGVGDADLAVQKAAAAVSLGTIAAVAASDKAPWGQK